MAPHAFVSANGPAAVMAAILREAVPTLLSRTLCAALADPVGCTANESPLVERLTAGFGCRGGGITRLRGKFPTGMVAIKLFVTVSRTETVLANQFTEYKCSPSRPTV